MLKFNIVVTMTVTSKPVFILIEQFSPAYRENLCLKKSTFVL